MPQPTTFCLFLIAVIGLTGPAGAGAPKTAAPAPAAESAKKEPKVPEDLLQDEHLREEFGVNEFTAPSIKKLFGELAALGPLPYEKLRRDIPRDTPKDRIRVALSLGMLIADGFLMVHSEKISEFENVGRGVLKHAKVLGAGDRISRHTKTILENSVDGDWDTLKNELAKTQVDVEAEMVLLRDVEIAHLISLGGWIRALEITSTAALDPFSEEKARKLARADLIEYFILGLDDLPPRLKERDPLKTLREGIEKIQRTIEGAQSKTLTAEDVEKLRQQSAALVKLIGAEAKK